MALFKAQVKTSKIDKKKAIVKGKGTETKQADTKKTRKLATGIIAIVTGTKKRKATLSHNNPTHLPVYKAKGTSKGTNPSYEGTSKGASKGTNAVTSKRTTKTIKGIILPQRASKQLPPMTTATMTSLPVTSRKRKCIS